jgi:hypothetical protein
MPLPIKVTALAAIYLLISVTATHAITGDEWRQLPELPQKAYVSGVLDAWFHVAKLSQAVKEANPSYTPGAMERHFAPITDCTQYRMSYGQVYAIVAKYVSQNPEHWHNGMPSLIWTAMSKGCSSP